MRFDALDDASFNELVEKGFVKKMGIGSDGKPKYQLTAKATDYLHKLKVSEALKQNSPEEIRKKRKAQES